MLAAGETVPAAAYGKQAFTFTATSLPSAASLAW